MISKHYDIKSKIAEVYAYLEKISEAKKSIQNTDVDTEVTLIKLPHFVSRIIILTYLTHIYKHAANMTDELIANNKAIITNVFAGTADQYMLNEAYITNNIDKNIISFEELPNTTMLLQQSLWIYGNEFSNAYDMLYQGAQSTSASFAELSKCRTKAHFTYLYTQLRTVNDEFYELITKYTEILDNIIVILKRVLDN